MTTRDRMKQFETFRNAAKMRRAGRTAPSIRVDDNSFVAIDIDGVDNVLTRPIWIELIKEIRGETQNVNAKGLYILPMPLYCFIFRAFCAQ